MKNNVETYSSYKASQSVIHVRKGKLRGWHCGKSYLQCQHSIWAPVCVLAALLPIQLPACGLEKQSRTAQSLGILHLCGRPRGSTWLWIGSAPAAAAAWGVNHGMEDLPLCLSSSLYICLSNKNK